MSLVTRLIRSPVRASRLRKGEAMDVVIEGTPHVVGNPLAYAGGEIFFDVAAGAADDSDDDDRADRDIQDSEIVRPGNAMHDSASQPGICFGFFGST